MCASIRNDVEATGVFPLNAGLFKHTRPLGKENLDSRVDMDFMCQMLIKSRD